MMNLAGIALAGLLGQDERRPKSEDPPDPLAFEVPAARKSGEADWEGRWEVAREEAQRRNCPIVLVISDDTSAGFHTIRQLVYGDTDFPELTDGAVWLAAFKGDDHDHERRRVGGEKVPWCSIFGCNCDHHRASHAKFHPRFILREFWNPMHVFLDPQLEELTRAEGHQVDLERLADDQAWSQKKLGQGMDARVYRARCHELRKLLDERRAKGMRRVWRGIEDVVTRKPVTAGMKAWGEELRTALLREGERRIVELRAKIEAGDPSARRQRATLLREYRDTELEEVLQGLRVGR